MSPWHKTHKKKNKEGRISEARALLKFWTKAGDKSATAHYKNLLKEIEEEIER